MESDALLVMDGEVLARLRRCHDQASRLAGDAAIAPLCMECGAPFASSERRGRRRYCSARCHIARDNRLARMRGIDKGSIERRRADGYWSRWAAGQKREALMAYGGARCACCGDEHFPFLTIDHIGGGGAAHRRVIRTSLYRWLRDQRYPSGFRVLCMNCNFATRFGRPCPHEEESHGIH